MEWCHHSVPHVYCNHHQMGRPNATCLPKSRSWPHAIQPLVLNWYPKRLWKWSFAGPHHGCCHSNLYRRWDIKAKMWQIWNDCITQWKKPPKNWPHFCGQVWHWIRHFVEWLGSRNGPTWSFSTMNHPSEAENRLEKIGALGCCPHSPYQWLPWFTHFNESTGFEESTFTLGGRSEFAPIPCQPPNMKQEKWRIFTTQSRIPKSSAWIRLA